MHVHPFALMELDHPRMGVAHSMGEASSSCKALRAAVEDFGGDSMDVLVLELALWA